GDWFSIEWESGMTSITLTQSEAIILLDSVSFVIKIQHKTAGHGIRIGLGRSNLQFFNPADARRFLDEQRDPKQVNVETLLKWFPLTSTSIVPPAGQRRPATSPQPGPKPGRSRLRRGGQCDRDART